MATIQIQPTQDCTMRNDGFAGDIDHLYDESSDKVL